MAKTRGLRTALDELREYANSLAPQRGMFSTADELIQEAPFERAPVDQWRGYLQPGRMLRRGDTQFPLKKEEVDYLGLDRAEAGLDLEPGEAADREELLAFIRANRPEFRLTHASDAEAGVNTAHLGETRTGRASTEYGPGDSDDFDDLSHVSPNSRYEESITRMKDLDFRSHFGDDAVSWSRTSSHPNQGLGSVRLVEEIQSDLHHAAAQRPDTTWVDALTDEERSRYRQLQDFRNSTSDDGYKLDADKAITELKNEAVKRIPRRGYRTPEDEALTRSGEIPASRRVEEARGRVPDAPFKNPSDYGALELRKQLLNAVNEGQDYLAITRGSDQIARYEQGMNSESAAGMRHVYDKIYRRELEKLAKRYGAEMTEVELEVSSHSDNRPLAMVDAGYETISEMFADGPEVFNLAGNGSANIHDNIQSGMSEIEEYIGRVRNTVRHVREIDMEGDPRRLDRIVRKLDSVEERLMDNLETTLTEEGPDVEEARRVYMNAIDDFVDLEGEVSEFWDSAFWDSAIVRPGRPEKKFPAIKLTPEVRERIKRTGVPLWSAAGLVPLEDEREEFQSGGRVRRDPSKTLERHREYDPRLGDRALTALRSQWSAIDPDTGEPRSVFLDWEGVDPRDKPAPGIVDEVRAIPAMFGWDVLGSQDAMDRTEETMSKLMEREGLDPPSTLGEHAATSLGYMAGQMPIPAGAAAKAGAGALSKIRRGLDMASEFFTPAVTPLAGYGAGTALGAGIGVAGQKTTEELDRMERQTGMEEVVSALVARAEAGDEEAMDVLEAMMSHYGVE
jgi:hypothetical protein